MKNAQKRSNQKGPDPFFTEFKKSSDSNPDKEYYKDIVKKLFMAAGAIFIFRLLTGTPSRTRTMDPRLE